MSEILIGTSGYYYDDWKETFYPRGIKAKDYLDYYSSQFNVLELNFTYYRLPEADQSRTMIDRSGGKLEFVVKAFRGMTHEISETSLSESLPLFLNGISPFVDEGRLGAVLLQFPQGFHYTTDNRVYLKNLIEALLPLPIFVEFRQRDWLRDSVYESLREFGVGFVCLDEPSLPALIPSQVITTSNTGYVRFHGRNRKNWYGTDSRRRYDYLYSEDELKEWVPRIRELAEETEKVFVLFNNHAKAQAVTNAKMLIDLLI